MNYTVSFVRIIKGSYAFDHDNAAALRHYQELQRESLVTPGGILPVTSPSDWSSSILFEDKNEHVFIATFYSTLGSDEFRRLMESRLIPDFADRVEVALARPGERSAVLAN